MESFYSEEELETLGLGTCGQDVKISRKVSIYGAEKIVIGSHVRIDDFCILSGQIQIGDHVHVAAYSALYGGNEGIVIGDFGNVSSRVVIYAVSDDYSGESMTNPMIPDKYKKILEAQVVMEKHVIIATGSTILPGVILGEGCAIGAMSLIKKNVEPWTIVAGIPAKYIKPRSRKMLELEEDFMKEDL